MSDRCKSDPMAKCQYADTIKSLRHELANERAKIGVLLKAQIDDRDEIERLRTALEGGNE